MGDQYPAGYRGTTFFADYMCEWIDRADMSGSSPAMPSFATGWENGVDLESAPDGNLAYVADNEVREVVYGPGNHRPAVAPSRLPKQWRGAPDRGLRRPRQRSGQQRHAHL